MPAAESARSKRSMSVCNLSLTRSWLSSDGTACLIARHSPAFLRHSTHLQSRPCARSCFRTCWPDLWRKTGSRLDCGTGREPTPWSSMSMARDKPPENLPCPSDLPPAQRRMSEVCAPGYLRGKRGEVVRTRTTVLQAHTHQWVGL